MKIQLQNTSHGLIPLYDTDFEEKKRLKIGEIYTAEIKKPRNIQFHRKYFALINCAWNYQNEKAINHFKNNVELFRKTIEIAAGHCDMIYIMSKKEWCEVPKSISFSKMDNLEFQKLYDSVLGVILKVFLKEISQEEFERNLVNFL